MHRKTYGILLVLTLAGLCGCSSEPSAKEAKKPATAPDKIQGKAQLLEESSASDAAMNAGGPSVYIWEGVRRYRLFFKSATDVVQGKEYIAEGVYAQKAIDEIGDPDQGKNGYPLQASCAHVVRMAWSGVALDVADLHSSVLRARIKRYPARPIFLVTRLTPVSKESAPDVEEDLPEVSVPADKQRELLIEGPAVQPAPLWEPAGGTVHCKVVIGKDGKITELESGTQLCEIVPWSQFRYQPPVQKGKPAKVKSEVEVRFEPRK